jgi:hypothetical protein
MPVATINCLGTDIPEGSFPVSLKLGWHGGLHLHAPAVGSTALAARAIADGEVVFACKPKVPVADPEHPQNYNPYGTSPAWTDNGMVIVRHSTEIGDGEDAQDIVFYSIFMHLSELRGTALKCANGTATSGHAKVYRKEELGVAGRIYNAADHIHFEIVCDDANCRKLVGRSTGSLNLAENGRLDAVYGEIYFHLPSGTCFYADRPPANTGTSSASPIYTSDQSLIVGLRHANGDGPVGHRGDDFLTTYQLNGRITGEVVDDHQAEYEMYRRSVEISKAFPVGSRPAPSAVYELLRFGRVVNGAHETLQPADCPHWRCVSYAGGKGWVNLNARGVTKYSDADLPQWKFWSLIDDDSDGDSRASSPLLNRIIESVSAAESNLPQEELERYLGSPEIRNALSRVICKFPSEWNRDTIESRWGWLQTSEEAQLAGDDWTHFKEHVEALAVPSASLPEPLRREHWHFHPSAFISHFRKCRWLSAHEFRQLVPKHALRKHSGTTLWEAVQTSLTGSSSVALTQRQGLNRMARKYGISSPLRLASFYGNAIQETQWLGRLSEAGGNTLWYSPWYGRGFLQLTHPENYIDYWRYRGREVADTLRATLVDAKTEIANQPVAQRDQCLFARPAFPPVDPTDARLAGGGARSGGGGLARCELCSGGHRRVLLGQAENGLSC